MNKQPLFILLIGFVLGVFFQDYFLLKLTSLLVILFFGFLSFGFYYAKNWYLQKLRVATPLLLAFSVAAVFHYFNSITPKLPELKSKEILVFTLDKKLNSSEKTHRYIVEIIHHQKKYLCVLSIPKDYPQLDFKHFYEGEIFISKPTSPENNFQFNYAKYLQRQDIYFSGFLPKNYKVAKKLHLDFFSAIKQNRLELLETIDTSGLNHHTRNFLKGIILADRSEMDSITVQDFNRSGLTHFIAISGAHIVIIFWLIQLMIQPLFSIKNRKYAFVVSLILIWSFALYIDFGNSVVRSCIMISAYYAYLVLQRKSDLLHALSMAGLLILVTNTQELFNVGFQLSFLAVLGIYWFNQPILNLLPKMNSWFTKVIYSTISISASAQFATTPLSIFYFHQFSWMSIPANLIIVPLSEIVILSSLVLVLLFKLNLAFAVLKILYQTMIGFLLQMIHWFADHDFLFFKMIPMTIVEMILLFISVYFLKFVMLKFNLKTILKVLVCFIIFFLVRLSLNESSIRKNEILIVDNFKERVIIHKIGSFVTFYISEKSNKEKIISAVIEPYLTSRRISKYDIQTAPSSIVKINNKVINLNDR